MTTQLLPVALPPTAETALLAEDQRVVETLRAQLLDEMERLASEEALAPTVVIANALMQDLSVLCFTGLHYLLTAQGQQPCLTTWVEDTLSMLARTRAITTHYARRAYLARPLQSAVGP